jgi:hypothetical protein
MVVEGRRNGCGGKKEWLWMEEGMVVDGREGGLSIRGRRRQSRDGQSHRSLTEQLVKRK